jgi:L-fuconolactonase
LAFADRLVCAGDVRPQTAAPPRGGRAGDPVAMQVDAHVHFWQIGRNDCMWPPPELAEIHRDFLPGDWLREAEPLGIDAAIVVQSQPSARDTAWLLELARNHACIAGVVGWADLAAPDAPARIAALGRDPKLRGLRPMLQDLPEDDWLLRAELVPAIEAMIAHDLCLDALVRPRHLQHLVRFAERHPALSIVIDHAAKPDIARGALDPWRAHIAELATLPQVTCKLSGLLTEAGEDWRPDELRLFVEHLLATFGPRGLLWGSDWPVVNLASGYPRWFALADALTGVAGDERAALFGDNAARVYGIGT